ncbi:hypothetical protein V0288_10980 [Pannus brasiliensis CCIBt3594]|uniref:Uncharacterized protein n=1 Tax=Pannus brasiliensis CCIBt3594 TaxID=1427578 RepID=A0AAW9QVI2_9CHRO
MSYRQLTLSELKTNFNLSFIEGVGLFEKSPEVQPSRLLQEILVDNIP